MSKPSGWPGGKPAACAFTSVVVIDLPPTPLLAIGPFTDHGVTAGASPGFAACYE